MPNTATAPPPEGFDNDVTDTGRLDGASRWRVFSVLTVIVLYTEVAPLQYIMIAAALQKMGATFPTVGANLSWAVIILTLVGASATPLLGKMSDVWGKKRLFLCCGGLFIAGCLIDALTTNWTLFLIGRALQAFAIATQVISYGLIRDLMPRRYVPVGLGLAAAGLGFSGVLAPVIGGFLVDHFDWQAMFWFLAIFTLIMTPIVMLVVPESKLRVKERIDPIGALLLSGGAGLTLLYLDKGQDWGWSRPTTLAWLVAGVVLIVLFFVVENRVSRPIMDMKLLRHPKVSMVLLMTFFGVFVLAVQSYALGYMTQTPSSDELKGTVAQGVVDQAQQMTGATLPISVVRVALEPGYSYGSGFSLLQYAIHLGIWTGIVSMIFGPLGGIIARRTGARTPAIVALVVMASVSAGYALATTSYSWLVFAILAAIFGIGFGLFYAAVPILMVDAVPQEQQGIGLGMLGVTQSIGSGVGIAVVTALLNNGPITAHIDVMGRTVDQTIPQVYADNGWVIGFWMVTATTLIALIVALFMRHGRTPATGGA
ncbi:MFS transporter [Nocardia callitridis]|uniref:MFS transporter n=1 Tax=Nocardia callitridis TaxID=648753 RepID=A0ABP9KLF2_9NOCA